MPIGYILLVAMLLLLTLERILVFPFVSRKWQNLSDLWRIGIRLTIVFVVALILANGKWKINEISSIPFSKRIEREEAYSFIENNLRVSIFEIPSFTLILDTVKTYTISKGTLINDKTNESWYIMTKKVEIELCCNESITWVNPYFKSSNLDVFIAELAEVNSSSNEDTLGLKSALASKQRTIKVEGESILKKGDIFKYTQKMNGDSYEEWIQVHQDLVFDLMADDKIEYEYVSSDNRYKRIAIESDNSVDKFINNFRIKGENKEYQKITTIDPDMGVSSSKYIAIKRNSQREN